MADGVTTVIGEHNRLRRIYRTCTRTKSWIIASIICTYNTYYVMYLSDTSDWSYILICMCYSRFASYSSDVYTILLEQIYVEELEYLISRYSNIRNQLLCLKINSMWFYYIRQNLIYCRIFSLSFY